MPPRSGLAPELGAHRLNTIAGPLVIEGGVAEGRDRSLRPAVMLPHESTLAPNETVSTLDEATSTDTLNVFNDNSVADDFGELTSTELDNELVTLRIEIPPASARVLQEVRDRAMNRGVIVQTAADTVPAFVLRDGKRMPAEIRIKGDWIDHVETDRWSLRIRLDRGPSPRRAVTS